MFKGTAVVSDFEARHTALEALSMEGLHLAFEIML